MIHKSDPQANANEESDTLPKKAIVVVKTCRGRLTPAETKIYGRRYEADIPKK